MSLTGVFVSGLSGRMGQEIHKLTLQDSELRFCGGLNREGAEILDSNIDVVVDFSLPEAMDNVVRFCQDKGLPLVSGTTGLRPEDNSKLIGLSRHLPVFWSANMSLGVFVLNRLVEALASYDLGFRYEISETHHVKKLDAPSGTAIQLEKTAKTAGLKLEPTISHREGTVFGVHDFKAIGPMETISLSHAATDRQLFASGALKVARWLHRQKPAFYDMRDFVENR